jgi:hypothetical protein
MSTTAPTPSQAFPDPIPGIIPFGTLTIFAGAPGVGKTAMLAEWIARWRTGRTICSQPTCPATAYYYLAADRQWASHAQWFEAVGYPEIPHYSLADDLTRNLAKFYNPHLAHQLFLESLDKLTPIPGSHVFVDPVAPLYIPGNPNHARDVALGMLALSRVCSTLQLNITCAAHFGKQKADTKDQYIRPQDRIAGSGAFSGFTDTQIYMLDPLGPKQPFHTLGWNPRHQPAEEFRFTRAANGLFIPYELFDALDRREKLLAALPTVDTSASIIIKLIQDTLRLSRTQAYEQLDGLLSDGWLVKVGRGFYRKAKPN